MKIKGHGGSVRQYREGLQKLGKEENTDYTFPPCRNSLALILLTGSLVSLMVYVIYMTQILHMTANILT